MSRIRRQHLLVRLFTSVGTENSGLWGEVRLYVGEGFGVEGSEVGFIGLDALFVS